MAKKKMGKVSDSPGRSELVLAAKWTAAGVISAALIGFATALVKTEPPKASSSGFSCIDVLDRLDRYVGSDQNRVEILTAGGGDGVAPIDREPGALACGVGREELEKMVDRPALPPAQR